MTALPITERYSDYKYFIGILKSDGYGHGMRVVNELEKNGVNYFAVATLDEARELRRFNADVPVLLLEPVDISRIGEAEELNLTLPIHELCYAKELLSLKREKGLKCHIQVDSGFNRLGIKDKNEFLEVYTRNILRRAFISISPRREYSTRSGTPKRRGFAK